MVGPGSATGTVGSYNLWGQSVLAVILRGNGKLCLMEIYNNDSKWHKGQYRLGRESLTIMGKKEDSLYSLNG